MTKRSSLRECIGSGTVIDRGSKKKVAASVKETSCVCRFDAALIGSHSNSEFMADEDIGLEAERKRRPSESMRRRESKHPSPHQGSCETRNRRSRSTFGGASIERGFNSTNR